MLIDKYKDMPEGEYKDLISQLPERYQEALTISSATLSYAELDIDSMYVAVELDGTLLVPADPKYFSIFARLTEIVREEYRCRRQDDISRVLQHITNLFHNAGDFQLIHRMIQQTRPFDPRWL